MLVDKRDKAAGIPIEGSRALELFCQEVRKCREEDEKNSEEDPEGREYEDKNRRTRQFRDECWRKWKELGKTEKECREMWPQALADWRAGKKIKEWTVPEFDTMLRRKLSLIGDSAEQLVPMQM